MKPEIKLQAEELIARLPKGIVTMMGHPGDKPPANDPTMTSAVQSICSHCKTQVWATELKVAVLELSPESIILCVECLTELLKSEQA